MPPLSVCSRTARLLAISVPVMSGFILGALLIFSAWQAAREEPGVAWVLMSIALLAVGMGTSFAYLRRIKQDLAEVRDAGEALQVIQSDRCFVLPLSDIIAISVRDAFPLELITIEDAHGEKTTFAVAHRNAITRLPSPVVEMLWRRVPRAFDAANEGRLSGPVEQLPWWARFTEILIALPFPLLGVFITSAAYMAARSGHIDPPPPSWFGPTMLAMTTMVGALAYLVLRTARSPNEVYLRGAALIIRETHLGYLRERCIQLSEVADVSQSGPWGRSKPIMLFTVHLRDQRLPRVARRPITFITRRPENAIALLQTVRSGMVGPVS